MPIFNTTAKIIAKPIPRVITPKAHAVVDYITVGSFLANAARFWKRNKPAAIASLICGGAELAVNLLTDYPGGVEPVISYPTHLKLDLGLAAMAAMMPEILASDSNSEKAFFLTRGALITMTSELSHTPKNVVRRQDRRRRMYAA